MSKPAEFGDTETGLHPKRMSAYSAVGGETLRAVENRSPRNASLPMGIDMAESHHGKRDGSGYPRGQTLLP